MPRHEAAVLWKGEVAGRLSRVWDDGHTDRMSDAGTWERVDDASAIIRACVRQLLSRVASAGRLTPAQAVALRKSARKGRDA